MKVKEAIYVLKMMGMDDEVELVFPNCQYEECVSPIKPMTEGEMATLPMHPKQDDMFMFGDY